MMKPLMLDFAERRLLPRGLIGLVLLGFLFVLVSYAEYTHKEAELLSVQQELTALKQAQQAKQEPRKLSLTAEEKTRQQEIALALQRLALPWDGLFRAVEAPSNEQVILLELQPDVDHSQVVLSGEAMSFDALGRYVEELQKQEVLRNVHLISHQVQLQSPVRPIRFVVRADWQLSLIGNK